MPSKSTINAVGALATGAIIFAGGFLVAKPQFDSASEYRDKQSQAESSRALEEARLLKLKNEQANLEAIRGEVNALKQDIPDSEDIAGLSRVVVESLPSGVQLDSFIHRPLVPVAPVEAPVVNLGVPEAPVDTAPDDTAPAAPPSGPPVLQQLPLVITVSAPSTTLITEYIDNLGDGPRPILVTLVQEVQSQTDDGKSVKTATIYGYAFANAPSSAPPAPASPETPAG